MYVELHCHSSFSLLDGASDPEALVERARALGYPALALTDHDDLGGVVRFAQAAREAGVGGIVGAELTVDVSVERRASSVEEMPRDASRAGAHAAKSSVSTLDARRSTLTSIVSSAPTIPPSPASRAACANRTTPPRSSWSVRARAG